MKHPTFILLVLFISLRASVFAWTPQGDKIKTPWALEVTPENAWQTYPRPQLQREAWINLNGLWQCAVTDMNTNKSKVNFDKEILVPFAIESSLSGIAQPFKPTDKLWYRREFRIDPQWRGKQIILHFGAVDYECTVWVNNRLVGTHKGGNNPFSFDITKYVRHNVPQVVELSVTDPTDTESITRGKQQLDQRGIWYTPVSGIWQTVWLEAVHNTHIRSILPQSDIAKKTINLKMDITACRGDETLKIVVSDKGKEITTKEQKVAEHIKIELPRFEVWSPQTPQLYQIEVTLYKNDQLLDKVKSYFAMREVSMQKDSQGYNRVHLNGKPVFQYGTLDQGWWPDGLLTPPSPEAMLWDMVQLKDMGFNTIRKHIKIEPALYYYYADSLGLMMWQDMPSGFATDRKKEEHIAHTAVTDWNAPVEVAKQWSRELDEMIDNLRFFPCITSWVIFNEGWGQHNTVQIVNHVKAKDPERIINGVSGWTDRKVGDMYDVHNYPGTAMILPAYNDNRISVLGEFGGLGLPVQGSLWNPNMRNWGYKNLEGGVDLINDYAMLMYDLETLIAQGLSAAIYTQTTDVEGEVNGLITYDRRVTKLPKELMHILHARLYQTSSVRPVTLIEDGQGGKSQTRRITINGTEQQVSTPYAIVGESKIYARKTFDVKENYTFLSLFLNVKGAAKVWINGRQVLDKNVRQTRQYNQFNISNFSEYLIQGSNVFEIEVEQKDEKGNFDYGLKAF